MNNSLKIVASGDREIIMTRPFDAPRALVFEALTRCELLKRWLLGPPGWSMVVCKMDLKAGGAYRWVWRNDSNGTEMGVGGMFREIQPPERIVHTEKFDQAWYSGEALITTVLTELAGQTTLTATMLYDSRATRDNVLKSPMESGVKASYDRLEELLASTVNRPPAR
jgi:uncharacterized protein YndB with AHSA1/START domain